MSTEIRAYSLSAFLAAISLFVTFRVRRRPPGDGRAAFVGLWALLTLLVYSHVAGGVVTAVLFGWGIFEWQRKPAVPFGRRLALTALAAGGTYLFWIPTTWRQFRTGLPWETPLTLSENVESLLRRSVDVLLIPQAFEQPFFLVGMAVLLGRRPAGPGRVCPLPGTLGSARHSRPRGRGGVAAAGIVLGAFPLPHHSGDARDRGLLGGAEPREGSGERHSREIPRRGRRRARGADRRFVLGSKRLLEGRWSVAERPKSGIRTLCRARRLRIG